MKKILLGICLLFTATFAKSQGLEGLIVEKYYVSNAADAAGSVGALPAGSVTWRFYVDMAPGYIFQAAYGDGNHLLRFQTTTAFFNNEDFGSTNANGINFTRLDDNTVMLDSYLSAGATCGNRFGVVKTEDDGVATIVNTNGILLNNDASAGIPLTVQDGSTGVAGAPSAFTELGLTTALSVLDATSNAGNLFSTNNGSWASLAGASGPTATNRVLIAQITTNGVLSYELNIQIRSALNVVENYVSSSPVGTEQLFSALAGTVNQANAAPTVSITAPVGGSTYLTGDPVTIDATAADADGSITNVEFLVDGSVVGSDNTAPYTFTWTSTVGSHNLTARATDNLGSQTTSAAINIIVGNVIAPTVSITAPVSGSTYVLGDIVTINATAADADGTVTGVEFFLNGTTSLGVDATSPYSINWPAVVGNFALTAVATDDDNATTTSAPVSITVFDSSSAYVLESSTNPCSANNFCLPLTAIVPVNDVIGYDIVVSYDNTKVTPTGVVTVSNDLINASYASTANSVDNVNGLMYISVFFNASAPANAEFNGSGELLCVQFARLAGFLAEDTTGFQVPSLQESYFNGVQPKVVSPAQYITFQENEYVSKLKFWFDNSPIKYDALTPSAYLITNITGSSAACSPLSATAVQPDLNGDFTYDYSNGPYINIDKNISNVISVQPVVNGFDAFLTRRVLINDASFVPSVYQAIAMDVNTDGVISAGDLSQINQRAVLIIGEFRQDWNYTPAGTPIPGAGPSKDWLFIDATTLNADSSYLISTNFPFDDGVGYSRFRVPQIDFCLEVPVLVSASCSVFDIEEYTGILVGDVNGNYATVANNGSFRSSNDKLVFDLSKAQVNAGSIDVPFYIISENVVNSVDFFMNFNQSKMNYSSMEKVAAELETLAYLNPFDNGLRFTSYSLNSYDLSAPVASVRFTSNESELATTDFSDLQGYLNGEKVTVEIVGTNVGNEVLVDVFPNPASSSFNVIASEQSSMQLLDLNGRVITEATEINAYQVYNFNTENLAKGVYMLKVYNNNRVSVKKVVIE